MNPNVLVVARYGRKWSVSSGEEVLMVTRTKKDAAHVASTAARILRASGGEAAVRVAEEPRSFDAED